LKIFAHCSYYGKKLRKLKELKEYGSASLPEGQMPLHLYRLGVAQGWGDEDISAIAKVMEHLSGK
jgi:3-hydroxyisobutyrate dehydrogenase-like beta-hydroxyacid dehydrogenase